MITSCMSCKFRGLCGGTGCYVGYYKDKSYLKLITKFMRDLIGV